MKLAKLIEGLEYEVLKGNLDVSINNINYDSRKVKDGDMFVCIKGFKSDGHNFIDAAINNGAKVIVCEDEADIKDGVTLIKFKDTRKALAKIGAKYYDNPCDKLNIIGVTGTNGKTTTAFMIKNILESCNEKVGLIGTIANYIGDEKLETERTTPESLELQELFRNMVDKGVKYCVMEVSSHSLALDRVYGVDFEVGIFTNLTRDHLDFHKTFENYYKAKYKLFPRSKTSIVNIDDKYGVRITEDLQRENIENFITYGIKNKADIMAKNEKLENMDILFDLVTEDKTERVLLPIPGEYNIYNALGAISACKVLGISLDDIKEGLKHVVVPGRCERAARGHKLPYEIIIDYAHTPDGLENILKTAREFTRGRLISVFGCGGDRDKVKRPQMGKIGTDLSDIAVITSDNPRSEEPDSIIDDIIAGIEKDNYIRITNRHEGIEKAMEIAEEGDVIVIAGKGHETYQILNTGTIHFDEREVIEEILKKN
ncbi:UDP-N-acetylmuramoyl-L-alanyl-D-glutamate--2,6-diaminopimelate ligase [Clostridium baratii]|uniref:UDP-N-acetylmuramoyl-L-alanyl-D-glutamate--2, 6-diaminopimelate ligase n=1 Tax=Clostridium baratii TaxID=1561 RepID=UPI0009A3FE3C|nr:UDP-N-acetylmuramoyl-L-alanyl-D-glutamate--2,6-diaminopimelate ligase [Clostridium baratii]OPF51791.1 UDP-N-acetylmuramoyl-L-alanyl-D-glutamate--2,6-diaminopimelate ligase [Clostridium baratii]OPF53436.1 UDP-N-acetylmuramoyl-L-alanyl-D-glutamate--2,6-diaminopimelate ligase [Clostridium baratii]OPF57419.1 UDP-N-acetylmuramoyl-L-alanyl-D-glutamate--2,6-diaminopimelate ligase [Clostridium baratii]OPF60483.1 UDP-N-acetylmuramoyl-L-alanyl-D-glutamate--2,6-diaminopimelate ligase [Clostridium barat